MERTFNAQVDNGIFVVAHYLGKSYKDITKEEMLENISEGKYLARKLFERNQIADTFASQCFNNSFLVQPTQKKKLEAYEKTLRSFLEEEGSGRTCIVCGKKNIPAGSNFSYAPYMAGAASPDKFINHGNNGRSIDICGECLFLSAMSFMNTRKSGNAYIFNSDSDSFMEYITEEIQRHVSTDIFSSKEKGAQATEKTESQFFKELNRIYTRQKRSGKWKEANYIEFHKFSNAKGNSYNVVTLDADMIEFLREVDKNHLFGDFSKLGFLTAHNNGKRLLSKLERLIDDNFKPKKELPVSREFIDFIRRNTMNDKERELLGKIADKLADLRGEVQTIKDLKELSKRWDFRDYVIIVNDDAIAKKRELVFDDIKEISELETNFYNVRDYLIMEMQIRLSKGGM